MQQCPWLICEQLIVDEMEKTLHMHNLIRGFTVLELQIRGGIKDNFSDFSVKTYVMTPH